MDTGDVVEMAAADGGITGANGTNAFDAEELFESVAAELRSRGTHVPLATYRVQFNAQFTFDDARGLVEYLRDLGISDLYASPSFRARPGSMHGYDVVDHNAFNPEVGTQESFDRMVERLRELGLGQMFDIVPNHMGIGTDRNQWWTDVLENGPSSLYATFFDIDWRPLKRQLTNKVLLPVLGDHYGRVLEGGDLKITYDAGALHLSYYEHALPVNPRTYWRVLQPMLPMMVAKLGEEHDAVLELQSVLTGLWNLPPRTETLRAKVVERRREKEILKRRLAALINDTPVAAAALERSLARINGTKGDPRSFDHLHELLEEQAYRLSYWRVAAEEINYRRFFDINDLAAIRMENPRVFAETNRLLFELLGDSKVNGLRIDHPDGLWNPEGYFTSLQRGYFLELCRRKFADRYGATTAHEVFESLRPRLADMWSRTVAEDPHTPVARPLYVVAEKILARGETLPTDWPVHGTSGYDFTSSVAGVFVDTTNEEAISKVYEKFAGQAPPFDELVYAKKKLILRMAMASELNVLAHALSRIAERNRHSRDFTLGVLTDALREVVACFPIYRTYVTETTDTLAEHDRVAVDRAIRLARRRNPTTDASVYAFLRAILSLQVPDTVPEQSLHDWREFVMKFQQLTGPVMAKGLEDTAFYVYNRLVSLNEVGGEPERFGVTVAAFHRDNGERQRLFPSALLTTSTHDTKRSEDVRARISVLSELPAEWESALERWGALNAKFRTDFEGHPAPDRNEEYLLYQTLLGSYPSEPVQGKALAEYTERIVAYMRKATKEAKVHTSWMNADPEYDAAVESFVRGILAEDSPFFEQFAPLARIVSYHGFWGALSQALLKFTAPGVPDTYQGNEIWDLSLVDPDNRRPVDYPRRITMLRELRGRLSEGAALARELVNSPEDGRIKLFVTHIALEARRRTPELFGPRGAYVPLLATGRRADHVVAFARRTAEREIVVVAPRLTAKMLGGECEPPVGTQWADTFLPIASGRFVNLFTGATEVVPERAEGPGLDLSRLLANFPLALLERTERGSQET